MTTEDLIKLADAYAETMYLRQDRYEARQALLDALEAQTRESEALKEQAQAWKHEANAQKATVHEIYQLCTGSTGEPGDWNGAEPVRKLIQERDQARAELAAIRAQEPVGHFLKDFGQQGFWQQCKTEMQGMTIPLFASPAAKDAGLVADGRQPIETAPNQQIVLIHYKNSLGNGRTVKARFTPRYTEEASGDSDDGVEEYDAKNDRCTLVEGWWEQIDNWGDFSEVYIAEHKPTHWMPLPASPKIGGV